MPPCWPDGAHTPGATATAVCGVHNSSMIFSHRLLPSVRRECATTRFLLPTAVAVGCVVFLCGLWGSTGAAPVLLIASQPRTHDAVQDTAS